MSSRAGVLFFKKCENVSGFSLIELLITMAVMAVLLAVAIPNLREFMLNMRTSEHTNDLVADVAFARSEAIKRARPVSIVALGGDWTRGWTIAFDQNGNGVIDAGDTELRRGLELHTDFTLNSRASSGATFTRLTFNGLGALTQPGGGVEFALCRPEDSLRAQARGIRIFTAGRAEASRGLGGFTVACRA